MNLVLLNENDFTDNTHVRISGRRFEHLTRVTKIKSGDTVICGQINGKTGTGMIRRLANNCCDIEVFLDAEPPAPLPMNLVLALPRPKMIRRIIQAVTTLGVKNIFLINSWRVEKSYWQSPFLKQENLEQQMILGLEQAKDTVLPVIHFKRFFKKFVENELPDISKGTRRITAHPKTKTLCPSGINAPLTLVIGPEGGFIDIEIQTLENQGFQSYHIGPRILKVETAVPYLISRMFTTG